MSALALILAVLAGAAITGVVFYLVFFSARKNSYAESAQAREDARRIAALEADLKSSKDERERVSAAESSARARVIELEKALAAEKAAREQFESSKKQLTEQLQNLANQILRDSQKQLQETSEKGLQAVLGPLKEKLGEFQKQVGDAYANESRERLSLQREIERIVAANQQMTQETSNLTKALKGDSKAQGDWGEFVLETVLESSGLREGEEYVRQGTGLGLRDEDGRVQKPDIVINLPDDKHLIIDAKVSLPSYEQYMNAPSEEAANAVLKDLHTSVYKHIDGLSAKHYASHSKLRSPDFVLMFLPTEALFATVLRTDKAVLTYASERRVALASPSTLLATLKAVASIWKSERQNKNALEIAKQAGLLYDRFTNLLKSLESVGKALGDAQRHYSDAVDDIAHPSLGLARKIEDLKDLGAKAKKKMDAKYLGSDPADEAKAPKALPVDTEPA